MRGEGEANNIELLLLCLPPRLTSSGFNHADHSGEPKSLRCLLQLYWSDANSSVQTGFVNWAEPDGDVTVKVEAGRGCCLKMFVLKQGKTQSNSVLSEMLHSWRHVWNVQEKSQNRQSNVTSCSSGMVEKDDNCLDDHTWATRIVTVKHYLAHWGCVGVSLHMFLHVCFLLKVFQILIFVSHFCFTCSDELYKLSSLWFRLELMRRVTLLLPSRVLCLTWDCIKSTAKRILLTLARKLKNVGRFEAFLGSPRCFCIW